MSDHRLLSALSGTSFKKEASDFVGRHLAGKQKKATMVKLSSSSTERSSGLESDHLRALVRSWKDKEASPQIKELVKKFGPQLAAALGGAALVTGIEYASNKPSKKDGLSMQQRMARAAVSSSEAAEKGAREAGQEPGFSRQVATAASKGVSGVADVFAKSPGKAALVFAPSGALAGLKILKAIKK